ncbi:MAG: hypothetical protein KatS3mg121_1195 [Gammaproteobacteria bacterium]|nr:MAG: hypothetical protein KatS3mg121_1195 [Gammaproteobacteria bacterium]
MHRAGAGAPLVLLHGWSFDARVWQPLLENPPPGRAVWVLELPGHGASAPAATADDWLGALLVAAPPRAEWAGWSLGGLLALAAAAAAPERVSALTVLQVGPRFLAAPSWPAGVDPADWAAFGAALRADPTRALARFDALLQRGEADAAALRARLRELRRGPAPAPAALAQGLALLSSLALEAVLAAWRGPLRAVFAAGDALVDAESARAALTRLNPRARVTVWPRAGHAGLLLRDADLRALWGQPA